MEPAEALCSACYHGELENVRRLLAEGVSPGSVSGGRHSSPALMRAVLGPTQEEAAAVVGLLLGAGAGVDVPASSGWTALMLAAGNNRPDIVRMLLRAGADPALKNKDGRDALAIAEIEGHADVAALLR